VSTPSGPESGGFGVVPDELHEGADELLFMPDATAADWAVVFSHAQPLEFDEGEELVRAGEEERALYLLVEGSLGVKAAGATRRFKAIEAPSVVGELAFVDGGPRSATLEALSDATVVRLDKHGFDRLAAAEPELARRMLLDIARILAARLRMASELLSGPG
jgi:CRP-like cAMP-binding protein